MRCHAYVAEHEGRVWVLHIFDVDGEEDEVAVALEVSSMEAYRSLQEEFSMLFRAKCGDHPRATVCAGCRRENDEWLADFTDLVDATYKSMDVPPRSLEYRDLPALARITFEKTVMGTDDAKYAVS